MYVEKAAETTFVQKMQAKNVDEIVTWLLRLPILGFGHFRYFSLDQN